MPGPLSRDTISTPLPVGSSNGLTNSSPFLAYLTRLVASSVATSATRPASASLKPRPTATASAWRRASATWLFSVTGTAIMALHPPRDRDARALARRRLDRELIREAFGAAQTQSETAPGAVAILERLRDVGSAGSLILEREPKAAPHPVLG